MYLLQIYKHKMDTFSVVLGQSCVMLYYTCILISSIEVFRRYVFNNPSEWAFETVMVLCATAWVLSAGFVTQQRRHIAITVLEMIVPKKTWHMFILVQMIISVFAVGSLAYAMYTPTIDAISIMERSGSAFNPASPTFIKTLLFIGSILYVLQICANIIGWFLDKK